jgi:hypothetical protein
MVVLLNSLPPTSRRQLGLRKWHALPVMLFALLVPTAVTFALAAGTNKDVFVDRALVSIALTNEVKLEVRTGELALQRAIPMLAWSMRVPLALATTQEDELMFVRTMSSTSVASPSSPVSPLSPRLREGQYYLMVTRRQEWKQSTERRVCAIDRGVRNVETVYDPDGRVVSVKDAFAVIKRRIDAIDKMKPTLAKMDNECKKRHKKKVRTKRRVL